MSGLESALARVAEKWGSEVLRPASALDRDRLEAFPTGIVELDQLTGIGGLPIGRISSFSGAAGAGVGTLLQLLAARASLTMHTTYLDLAGTLDPAFMAWQGAEFSRLQVGRPRDWSQALEMVRTLLRAGLPCLALDGLGRLPSGLEEASADLARLAHRAGCLFLTATRGHQPQSPLAYASSIWIELERVGWLEWHGDIVGVRVGARVVKNKISSPGGRVQLELTYPGPGVPRFQVPRP